MHRHQGSWRKHRPLHALLSAVFQEHSNIVEVAELGPVDAGLCTDGQWLADLRDYDADLAGGNLYPRKLADAVDRPELKAQTGHQQIGLKPGFLVECNGVALVESFEAELLGDEADFSWPYDGDRLEKDKQGDEQGKDENYNYEHGVPIGSIGVGLRRSDCQYVLARYLEAR